MLPAYNALVEFAFARHLRAIHKVSYDLTAPSRTFHLYLALSSMIGVVKWKALVCRYNPTPERRDSPPSQHSVHKVFCQSARNNQLI